jgi:glycosyltransferase involved in cell wall biosynthesis
MSRSQESTFAACAVVPVFNHEHVVGRVVASLRASGLPVLLVDDGSNSSCARVLDDLARAPEVSLVRLPCNQGKGAAVVTGLHSAAAAGFTHALQIDADGQHALQDVRRFIDEARAHPDAVICGRPRFDASIPKTRYYGRYLTHGLVWLHTLSLDIPDSMCGFRVYPLRQVCTLARQAHIGRRMDFDIEVLVRLHWRGTPLRWLTTAVTYPSDGVSHFRLGRDNVRIAACHLRLLAGMVVRSPWLLSRRLVRAWAQPRAPKQSVHA